MGAVPLKNKGEKNKKERKRQTKTQREKWWWVWRRSIRKTKEFNHRLNCHYTAGLHQSATLENKVCHLLTRAPSRPHTDLNACTQKYLLCATTKRCCPPSFLATVDSTDKRVCAIVHGLLFIRHLPLLFSVHRTPPTHSHTYNLHDSSLQQKQRGFKRPAAIHLPLLTFFLSILQHTQTHSETTQERCVWRGRHELRWLSPLPPLPPILHLSNPPQQGHFLCLLITYQLWYGLLGLWLCACACMSSGECVVVFSETPAWAYDRTVWLRFATLLRECEPTHEEAHIRASCLCPWFFVVLFALKSSCCLDGCAFSSLLPRGDNRANTPWRDSALTYRHHILFKPRLSASSVTEKKKKKAVVWFFIFNKKGRNDRCSRSWTLQRPGKDLCEVSAPVVFGKRYAT